MIIRPVYPYHMLGYDTEKKEYVILKQTTPNPNIIPLTDAERLKKYNQEQKLSAKIRRMIGKQSEQNFD